VTLRWWRWRLAGLEVRQAARQSAGLPVWKTMDHLN
jgi:hypothetical protein